MLSFKNSKIPKNVIAKDLKPLGGAFATKR